MGTAKLPPKLTAWLEDPHNMRILESMLGGAYAKLAPLYLRSLKRDEVELLQATNMPIMMYLFGESKKCLLTISEARVATLQEVKDLIQWCRHHRDTANDTPEKEDALEAALWSACCEPFPARQRQEWEAGLPKKLSEIGEGVTGEPSQVDTGGAGVLSPGFVAVSSTSRVEHGEQTGPVDTELPDCPSAEPLGVSGERGDGGSHATNSDDSGERTW